MGVGWEARVKAKFCAGEAYNAQHESNGTQNSHNLWGEGKHRCNVGGRQTQCKFDGASARGDRRRALCVAMDHDMLASEIVELASGEPYVTCSALVPEFCPTACWWCVELELCSSSWQECAPTSTPSKDGGGGSSASSGALPLMLTAVLLLLLACAAVAFARRKRPPAFNLMGGYEGSAHQDLWRDGSGVGGEERSWAVEPADDDGLEHATYEQQATPGFDRGCGGRESPGEPSWSPTASLSGLPYPMASMVQPSAKQPEGVRLLDTV